MTNNEWENGMLRNNQNGMGKLYGKNSDTSKLAKSLKNIDRKGYDLTTIVLDTITQAYFAKDIDNLLVQLVIHTSNVSKLVEIGTDFTDTCKSNYHTIMIMI